MAVLNLSDILSVDIKTVRDDFSRTDFPVTETFCEDVCFVLFLSKSLSINLESLLHHLQY
jgi:hypothetical protein